jgi:lipoate---protein ligase
VLYDNSHTVSVNKFLMESFRPPEGPTASPAQLLALDEALLDYSEATDHPGFLTFWEFGTYFVVLGYSRQLEEEVFALECDRLNIPVLRRCSGGGTVLQGPGCVNYSLILPIEADPELSTITGANCWIMKRISNAVAPLASGQLRVQGHTDLTLDGQKFSGNAQRRKRRSLLFHGSFLLNFDLSLISKTLRLPRQQPEYRQARPHDDFLTNAPFAFGDLQRALANEWGAFKTASESVQGEIRGRVEQLVKEKYSRDDWNHRF